MKPARHERLRTRTNPDFEGLTTLAAQCAHVVTQQVTAAPELPDTTSLFGALPLLDASRTHEEERGLVGRAGILDATVQPVHTSLAT